MFHQSLTGQYNKLYVLPYFACISIYIYIYTSFRTHIHLTHSRVLFYSLYCFYTYCTREMHDICYTWDVFSNETRILYESIQSAANKIECRIPTLMHSHSGLNDVLDHALLCVRGKHICNEKYSG